jgi:hypothetical protein
MSAMQHSIAAKYAARPAARFVRPSRRLRERRLGLRATTFQAASGRATVLRRADLGPYLQLRASWRSIQAAHPVRRTSGRPRHAVTMSWTRLARPGLDVRSGATPSPWLA